MVIHEFMHWVPNDSNWHRLNYLPVMIFLRLSESEKAIIFVEKEARLIQAFKSDDILPVRLGIQYY